MSCCQDSRPRPAGPAGQMFDIKTLQSDLDIGLSDVYCFSDRWNSCKFNTSHNCNHNEDVHISCVLEGKQTLFDVNEVSTNKIKILH